MSLRAVFIPPFSIMAVGQTDLGAFAYAIVTDCFLGERNVLSTPVC